MVSGRSLRSTLFPPADASATLGGVTCVAVSGGVATLSGITMEHPCSGTYTLGLQHNNNHLGTASFDLSPGRFPSDVFCVVPPPSFVYQQVSHFF